VTLVNPALAEEQRSQLLTDLLQYCRTQLAAFKVPRPIVILEAFPRSAAGKILKRVLREQLA